MKLCETTPVRPGATRGLRSLGRVELTDEHRTRLEQARATSGGPAEWRARKTGEARDMLALAQLAGERVQIQHLDLDESLRIVFRLRVPVPVARPADSRTAEPCDVVLADGALLAFTYRQDALLLPQSGFAFVQVLAPSSVFHPQVSADGIQALCLGGQLPAGVRVSELLLMTYGALSLQTSQLDAADPLGVMNVAAAEWWLQHRDRLPLTPEPFLGGS